MRNEKNMNDESGIGFERGDILPGVCAAAAGILLLLAGFLFGLEARGAEVTKDTLFGDIDGTKTTLTQAVQESWGEGKDVFIGEGANVYNGGTIAIGHNAIAFGKGDTTNTSSIAIGDNSRAYCSGSYGSSLAIGKDSSASSDGVAIGAMAKSYIEGGTAIGNRAVAYDGGVALGMQAKAIGSNAISIGYQSGDSSTGARGRKSIAIGRSAGAKGVSSIAIGYVAYASGDESVAVGERSSVDESSFSSSAFGISCHVGGNSTNSLAIGTHAHVSGSEAIAIGVSASSYVRDFTYVYGTGNIGIGSGVTVERGRSACTNSIAIGRYSCASNVNCVSIGANSYVSGMNSTAIGPNAFVTKDNALGVPYSPSEFYFNACQGKESGAPASRSLQEYLDGCGQYQFSSPEPVNVWHLFEDYSEEYDTWFTSEYTTPNGIACADGYIYDVTVTNGTEGVYFMLPEYASHSQDFIVRLACSDTNGTQIAGWGEYDAPGPAEVDWPNGDLMTTGSLKGTNYVTFTQTGANRWRISYYPANKEN